MKKVIIFSEWDNEEKLEKDINRFFSEYPECKIIDVKFNTELYDKNKDVDGVEVFSQALIIYEETECPNCETYKKIIETTNNQLIQMQEQAKKNNEQLVNSTEKIKEMTKQLEEANKQLKKDIE